MQLNGTIASSATTTITANTSNTSNANHPTSCVNMAASEPPEPPPRNPDKINASLKQIANANDSKSTKSADTLAAAANNNNSINHHSNTTLKTNQSFDAIASANTTPPPPPPTSSTSPSTTATTTSSSTSAAAGKLTGTSIANVNTTSNPKNHPNSTTSTTVSTTTQIPSASTRPESTDCDRTAANAVEVANIAAGVAAADLGNLISGKDDKQVAATAHGQSAGPKFASAIDVSQRNGCSKAPRGAEGDETGAVVAATVTAAMAATATPLSANEMDAKLALENERLVRELSRLKRLFEYSEDGGAVGGVEQPLSDSNSMDAHSTDGSSSRIERLEMELKMAKEQISHLRLDRRRLKSDKSDLLAHVKQLCASLQDKEQELRDFIRNYEQRIRDTDASQAKVSTERERERWSLLKHARDESERSLALATQLNARDAQLQRIQEQLLEARRQLVAAGGAVGGMSDQESLLSFAPLTPPSGMVHGVAGGGGGAGGSAGSRMSTGTSGGSVFGLMGAGGDSGGSVAGDVHPLGEGGFDGSDRTGPCITVDADSISLVSSNLNMYQFHTPKERSPTLSPLNSGSFSRSMDVGALSRSVEQLGSPVTDAEAQQGAKHSGAAGAPATTIQRRLQLKSGPASNTGTLGTRSGRGGTWGSISRVFARSRHRNKTPGAGGAAGGSADGSGTEQVADFQWAALPEESYAEKLRLLREASAVPIDRWRSSQVLAWLEVALGMPQYSARCAENVKSGKVLLELNDAELESGLGLTHPMHRKKVRLAIEEQRRPDMMRYQTIGQLGHTWVAVEWLPDIGLPQYAESFMHSLVDARMLDTLSKKELEKFLSVTRKFHQASIVHGIHVLRILKYDRQSLALRRMQCENVDADPIVWTNQRFIRWARSIDLGEYADNLKDSGVHGGLVVLEASFSGDTIATALGIPPSKNIIRRHLTTEFDALVLPARAQLGQGIRIGGGSVMPITGPGGLQQHPNAHQHHSVDRRSSGSLRFAAWRGSQGSLYKAFGFSSAKGRRADRPFSAGASGTGVIGGGSSTSPTPSYSSSSENGIYATIGPAGAIGHHHPHSQYQTHHIQQQHQPHYSNMSAQHSPSAGGGVGGGSGGGGGHYAYGAGSSTAGSAAGSPAASNGSIVPPPSHRVSAPPMEAAAMAESAMPQYAQHHRRVKSISDIEVVAATPV